MSLKNIVDQLERGLDTAHSLAATLSAVGVPYAGLARSLLEIAQNVKDRVEEGAIVATSEDRIAVSSILSRLQAENDRLNAEIEKS